TFSRLKGAWLPSRLTTMRRAVCSTRSYVVNRREQPMHSRRRRMDFPPSLARLSITLSLSALQKGQITRALRQGRLNLPHAAECGVMKRAPTVGMVADHPPHVK